MAEGKWLLMIDKRLNVFDSLLMEENVGAFYLHLEGANMILYCSSDMTASSYIWTLNVVDESPTLRTREYQFPSYLETEKWLKEQGYL